MSGEIVVAGVHHVVTTEFPFSFQRIIRLGLRFPATSLGILILILGSLIGLRISTTRNFDQREGLVRSLAELSDGFILIQSFQGDPGRPVPSLWNARLGVKPASELWSRQGGMLWWQAWSLDGEAYLILPAQQISEESQSPYSQRYGNLVVFGTDQLHREQLSQRIKAASSQAGFLIEGGLFASCLESLAQEPSVYWTADALASISGSLAPLLQQGREGCMQLRLQGRSLQWNGVISQRPLRSNPAKADLAAWTTASVEVASVDRSTLLHVEGTALRLILGTLLSRQIIQVPLEQNYGISKVLRSQISTSPFSLRLVARPEGFYRAGLQLQIPVSKDRTSWLKVLSAVSDRLKSRGYVSPPPSAVQPVQNQTLWFKEDDPKKTIVGGWRWLDVKDHALLSIGFGIEPHGTGFIRHLSDARGVSLVVEADPSTLTSMNLLSGRWPRPMTKASTMIFHVRALETQRASKDLWRMQGQLTLPQS